MVERVRLFEHLDNNTIYFRKSVSNGVLGFGCDEARTIPPDSSISINLGYRILLPKGCSGFMRLCHSNLPKSGLHLDTHEAIQNGDFLFCKIINPTNLAYEIPRWTVFLELILSNDRYGVSIII